MNTIKVLLFKKKNNSNKFDAEALCHLHDTS